MDIHQLQQITNRKVMLTEADCIIILYNDEIGAEVIPLWEYKVGQTDPSIICENAEEILVTSLIDFADKAGSCESIGTYAIRKEERPIVDASDLKI